MSHQPDERRLPSWLNRNVASMGVTSFLSDLGHETATAILPAFMASLGLGPFVLGAIEGVADGVSSGVKLGAGWFSDRVGNRKGLATLGYFLTGISKASFAFAYGWMPILAGRVVGWFGRGIRGPVRDAMLADSVEPAARGHAFGFHRAGDTIGAVAGPALALWVLARTGAPDAAYRQLFLWTLLPGVAAAIVFAAFVREPSPARAHVDAEGRPRVPLPPRFHRFLIAVGLFGLADFAPTLLILRTTDVLAPTLGSGAATVAVGFYTLRNIIYAAGSYPIGALSDRMPRGILLAVGYACFITVALGAAVAPRGLWAFGIIFVMSGVVAAAQDTLEGAIAADLLPSRIRGTGYGALAAVNGFGDLLSSALLGLLWAKASAEIAFGLAAALAAAGAFVMHRATRDPAPLHDESTVTEPRATEETPRRI
jgi:MFS family permease